MNETLFKLEDAHVEYGGVKALDGVSVAIDEGEIVALMGPNGAGKTTVIKSLFGIAPLSAGTVLWHEKALHPVPHQMPARGIAYVPQGRQVFKNLSVRENLELGGYSLPNRRADLENNIQEVLRFFPMLKEKLDAKAETLSGGQQQMLTIARALVADPKVLLLDEPSLGLAPKIVKEVFAKIKEINEARRLAVLIVEHSIASALSIAHRTYVLSRGKIVAEKKTAELGSDFLKEVFLS